AALIVAEKAGRHEIIDKTLLIRETLRTFRQGQSFVFCCFGFDPFVPNPYVFLFQVADVGRAAKHPKQFFFYGMEMNTLGGDDWKAFTQIVFIMYLAEQRDGADTRTVFADRTFFTDAAQ